MPTTYGETDDTVVELVKLVIENHHPELSECGVQIGVWMAYNPDKPALKQSGYPVLACIKVVSQKDRLSKGYDCELVISQKDWEDELTPANRIALIDHYISQLRRVPNTPKAIIAGEFAWKTDDRGRPKLKIRKADIYVGDCFLEVVSRHGKDAIEYFSILQAKLLMDAANNSGNGDDDEKETPQ